MLDFRIILLYNHERETCNNTLKWADRDIIPKYLDYGEAGYALFLAGQALNQDTEPTSEVISNAQFA